MKKNRAIIVILTITTVLIAAAAALILLQSRGRILLRSPMLAQVPSIITYIEGTADIAPAGAGDEAWIPAEVGMKVKQGDRIRTGEDGLVDIRVHDDGVIRILSDTWISLDVLTIRNQSIDIVKGTLFAKFNRLFDKQDLRFSGPDTVAVVRGTELVFEVDESGTAIHALSGITEIFNPDFPDQRILLAFQKRTFVASGAPPSDPEDLSNREVQEYRRVFNGINDEEVFLISQDILFAPYKAEILPESLDELDEVARLLLEHREKVLIAGHTADVGGMAAQVILSEQRAEAIAGELAERGVPVRRLSTIGYAGSRPVGDNDTAEGRAANRRVEFLIVE